MDQQDKKALRQERRAQQQKSVERVHRFRSARTWGFMALIVVVAGAAGWVWWFRLGAESGEFSATESCVTHQALAMHEHPHLSIVIDDEPVTIPAQVGIEGFCLRPVHTHDDTGKLHLEAPVRHTFVLGDFFTVWGKTFTRNQILDSIADENHRIVITVDGKEIDTHEHTELSDGQRVEIRYEAVSRQETGAEEEPAS